MGQETRLDAPKIGEWMGGARVTAMMASLILGTLACSHKEIEPSTELLRWLNVRADKSVIEKRDILGQSPTESSKRMIEGPKLDDTQKRMVLQFLPYFDTTSTIQDAEAYLISVQERRPGIVTIAIQTSSGYGDLLFLENWRGLIPSGFLVAGEGNPIGGIEENNNVENVRVSREWFEIHGDTVNKITRRAFVSHFFDGREEIETPIDSVVETYVISSDGAFVAVKRDSDSLATAPTR